MKATINSTEKIVTINGVPARLWQGESENGIKFHAFITRVAVEKEADCSEFEKELQECEPMKAEFEAFPTRMIIW